MRATIFREQNTVTIDGTQRWVDCSGLAAYIRVVQWNGEAKKGMIEFILDGNGRLMPNHDFTDFSPYAYLVEAWQAAADAEAARKAADAKSKAEASAEAKRLS